MRASSIKPKARHRLSISKLQYRTTPAHPTRSTLLLSLSVVSISVHITFHASHFSPPPYSTELSLLQARMNGRHFAAMLVVPELKRERDAAPPSVVSKRDGELTNEEEGWRERGRKREREKETSTRRNGGDLTPNSGPNHHPFPLSCPSRTPSRRVLRHSIYAREFMPASR